MNSVVLLLATSLLGVDYQISEIEGESVYIVQIEEAVARELANGFRINSTIPSEYSHIRRIQIEVIADDEADSSAELKSMNFPRLTPDESVVPQSTEIPLSTEINLEPEAFVLPNLSRVSPVHIEDVQAQDALIPLFDDSPPNKPSHTATADELLTPAPPIVSVGEITAPDRAKPNGLVAKLSSSTNTKNETLLTPQRKKETTSPPDLIKEHQGEFVALATTQQAADQVSIASANDTKENSATPLLLLFFSITLNFFLVFTIFQRYRQ